MARHKLLRLTALAAVSLTLMAAYLSLLHPLRLSPRHQVPSAADPPLASPSACGRNLSFSSVSLPVTALASVQGSGNTWLRHLLQQLTGIYSGSVYPQRGDPELWAQGYLGEGVRDGRVVAVKTHGTPWSKGRHRFHRAVLVFRNPYDAIFADFNRRATASHTGVAPARAYVLHWTDFVKVFASHWVRFTESWMEFKRPLIVLNFDDLASSLDDQMKKLAAFIQHDSLTMDITCALANSRGGSKRKKTMAVDKREIFTSEQIKTVNRSIQMVSRLLKPEFPEVSRAMLSWQRNVTSNDVWIPMKENIS